MIALVIRGTILDGDLPIQRVCYAQVPVSAALLEKADNPVDLLLHLAVGVQDHLLEQAPDADPRDLRWAVLVPVPVLD